MGLFWTRELTCDNFCETVIFFFIIFFVRLFGFVFPSSGLNPVQVSAGSSLVLDTFLNPFVPETQGTGAQRLILPE